MASRYSKWYMRLLYKVLPFLFKKCHGGNYHWFWERYCFCREHEYTCDLDPWYGGVYDFKYGVRAFSSTPELKKAFLKRGR
jgi:hypothetical protein